ncbi:hypothetical protein RIF29_42143 [Crotalaria pallida]|uniref:Uncharacterized protein n=1 Tax=Crotalaria pallida TaxID=3830 RepID=A0AAN9HW10_CROPI
MVLLSLRIQPKPRLPAAGPMQKTHRTDVEVPAAPPNVIPSQTTLVPPVLNGRHVSRENQQKRWQGTKLVDPVTLLDLYPPLYPARVPHSSPLHHIYHHHSRVEVTRPPPFKRRRESPIRPKRHCQIFPEIRMGIRFLTILEVELRECGTNEGFKIRLSEKEMEEDVVRALRMLKD